MPTNRTKSPIRSSVYPAAYEVFRDLNRQDVDAIRNAAVRQIFNASEIILTANEPSLHFFFLEKGLVDYSIETHDGREILLCRLIPGNPFGFAAVISSPMGYLGTVKAVDESEVLVWQHHVIHELTAAYPRLVENALRIALRYIHIFIERHSRMLSNNAGQRVAWALAGLASRTGHTFPSGLEVEVKNEELASLADVNSHTVSRMLHQWDREGTVKKFRGRIAIQRPERLYAGASNDLDA